jgi:hypothetical protein
MARWTPGHARGDACYFFIISIVSYRHGSAIILVDNTPSSQEW